MALIASSAARRLLIRKALDADFAILPLKPKGKAPAVAGGVRAASTNRKMVLSYFGKRRSKNYGIATGKPSGIMGIDVDGKVGRQTLEKLQEEHGKLPPTVNVLTGRGVHLIFRYPKSGVRNMRLGPNLDVKGDGGYLVGAGSVHPSGKIYRYARGHGLDEIEIAPAPKWLRKLVAAPPQRIDAINTVAVDKLGPAEAKRLKAYFKSVWDRELDRLRRAPVSTRNDTLNRCAFSLGQFVSLGAVTASEISAALRGIAGEIGLDEAEIDPTIQSGLIAGQAAPRQVPFLWPSTSPPIAVFELDRPNHTELAAKLASLGETDADNARRLVVRFGNRILHAPGRGWLVYNGKFWVPDRLRHRQGLALQTVQKIQEELALIDDTAKRNSRARFAEQSKSKGALDRMIGLAAAMVAVDDSKLDADPWLLNVDNGTIDLRTGELLPHDPRDLITKMAAVHFDPEATCPNWKRVLSRAVGDNKSVLKFLRKLSGYTLTGDVSEQIFAYLHGRENTSKSTVANTFRDMLGDYAVHTSTETLLIKSYDNAIPNDLARLKGARMVTAIEANFGRQLDEAKIKAMTGGDKLAARFMRSEWFDFVPEFKLWIVANDFLRVRQSSGAFWRRVRVIPFDIEIPPEERDPHLPDKLRAERPGILAWAVRGCLAWRRHGLGASAAIGRAAAQWRDAVDHVRTFLNEACVLDPEAQTPASLLHAAYTEWCYRHGERAMSTVKFKVAMIDYNVSHKRTNRGSIWAGIKLKT